MAFDTSADQGWPMAARGVRKETEMKSFIRIAAALCLAAVTLAARAETVQVTVSGTFALPAFGGSPTAISLQFSMPRDVPGAVPIDETYSVADVPIRLTIGSSTTNYIDTSVAWFDYAASFYSGVDIRFFDIGISGDMLQFIVQTPSSPYSGSEATPQLNLVDLDGLYASATYTGPPPDREYGSATTFDATYQVASVPEPAALVLMPLGLAIILARRRRRSSVA